MKNLLAPFLALWLVGCATVAPAPVNASPTPTPALVLDSSESLAPAEAVPQPAPTPEVKTIKSKSLSEKRTIFLKDGVNQAMADKFVAKVDELVKADSKAAINVVIDSPGGSVDAGRKMIVKMKATDAPFHCYVDGMAASMAAMIFEQCDKRYVQEYAVVMFHEMSFGGLEGPAFQLKSYMDHAIKHWTLIQKDTAARIGIDLKDFQDRSREEWWLIADEAVNENVADAVVVSLKYEEPEKTPELPLFSFPF